MHVINLIQKALNQRAFLTEDQKTNSFRLFDGEGDGISDIYIDQLGDNWLLSTTEGIIPEELKEAVGSFGKTVYWKKLDQYEKESPTLLCGAPVHEPFIGLENGLEYELSFSSGYSQGLFLDQRENRARIQELVQPEQRILNTFAYTGAFSVVAASAGGITTTLDLSQPYLDWTKRNMSLNAIDENTQFFCKGDTFHWLARFAKSGKKFHGIILDPPTFSRDTKGKVFRVEKDYHRLIKLASSVLEDEGWILACSNCRKMPHWQFEEQIQKGMDATFISYDMPAEYTGEKYLKIYFIRPNKNKG